MKKHLHHILTLWLAMICAPHLLAQQQYVDITDQYIKNADFKKGLTGWTAQADGGNWSTPAGKDPEVFETWAREPLALKTYSLTQEINLPAGDYKLEAYAFYRQGKTYDTDKTKSLAYLIAGSNKVLVKTLGSENANPYANDVTQASAAFASGLYLNSLQFNITSEDGTSLKIGYEGTHDEAASWFITGPFKLYRAMTAEEKYNLIKQEIENDKNKLNPV